MIRRSPDKTALILTVVALLLAGGAQAIIQTRLSIGTAGFFAAILLIAFARTPEEEDVPAEPRVEGEWPTTRFWVLVAAGVLCCVASGITTFLRVGPIPTQILWFLGLLLLIGSTLLYRRDGPRDRLDSRTGLVLLALFALSALFLAWHLTTMPPEVHGDDAEVGLDAIRILQERPFDLFRSGWFGLPRFHAAPTALGLKIFGINLLGLRATSAVLGTATVLVLFALARRLWGFEVAVLASLFLVSQRFFIHLSRAGYHYIDTPFVSVVVLWLFVRVWQERKLGSVVWCGIVLGLGVQTYFASRLVPVLLLCTFLLWILTDREKRTWGQVACFGLIGLIALATAAPAIGYFSHHLDELWGRTSETSVFSAAAREHLAYGYGTNNLTKILLIQARAALKLFNVVGDNSIQYGYEKPLLEPVSGVLFVLGLGMAVGSIRRRRNQLLLLWILLPFIAGAVLTIDTPFFPRISGLIPFVALAVAVALHQLLTTIRTVLPESAGRRLAATLGVILVATVFLNNVQTYFRDYAPHHRDSPAVEISHWIVDNAAGKTTYMVGGAPRFYIHHGTITFMTWGYDKRDIIDLDQYLKTSSLDPRSSVFIVMPAGHALIPKLIAAVGPLSIEEHRDIHGQTAFYTAVPQAAREWQSSLAASLARKPKNWRFDEWLRLGQRLLIALIAVTGFAVIVLLLRRAVFPFATGLFRRWRPARTLSPTSGRLGMLGEGWAKPPNWATVAVFVVIVALATVLRVYHLDELPAGFYCDEAGLGYNATSILRTGYDENGAFLPLYVWSFGVSYKNPVFIYSSMLPIAVLGPTELAVRLTAAAYGIATVIALFFLGRAMGGTWVGLLAALLLAVCPWHLHFSRIGFELITEPFFFIVGLTFLVSFIRGRRRLLPAAFFFALTVYTYVPAKLFVPLFLAGVLFVYRATLRRRWRETAAAVCLFVVMLLPVGIFDWQHRHQSSAYFQRTTILERGDPPLAIARTFLTNYATFFSPTFLFYEGGDRIRRHSVRDHGELYPFFAPLLLVGVAALLLRRDPRVGLPLLWLAAYPVAPALMNEIPSASRGFIGGAAFCLVAGIGAAEILWLPALFFRGRSFRLAVQIGIAAAGILVLGSQVAEYWTSYSVEYPKYSAKYYTGFQFGQRQVAAYFIQHYDEYDEMILTQRQSNQADVFLRFYDGLAQPARHGIMPPFEHREKMRVGWPDDLEQYRHGRRLLFAARPNEVPLFENPNVKERIIAPDGSAAFVIVEAGALKPFVHTWQVTGPFEPGRQLTPPIFDPSVPAAGQGAGNQGWRLYEKPIASVGLNDFFGIDLDNACAWAVNFVQAEEERQVQVWAGFDDEGEVWLNGKRLPLRYTAPADDWIADSETATARLRPGRNTVAVHTCEETGDWRFYFRMTAADGSPLPDVRWEYESEARAAGGSES